MSRIDNSKWKDIVKDCTKYNILPILEEYKNKLSQKKPQIHHLARTVYSDYLLLKKSNKGICECITCWNKLKRSDPNTHPWHFRTAWTSLKHKFNDDNVRPQDYYCNVAKNGNYQVYTLKMIDKFWRERVDNILNDKDTHTIKSYEYAEKIEEWYNILQELKTLVITP